MDHVVQPVVVAPRHVIQSSLKKHRMAVNVHVMYLTETLIQQIVRNHIVLVS